MWLRCTCWLLVLLATGSFAKTECDLDNPSSLAGCAQEVLNSIGPMLTGRFDPLRLPDQRGSNWHLDNIHVDGLSKFKVKRLSVKKTASDSLRVLFSVAWPQHVQGRMNGKVKLCKRIIFKKFCISPKFRPVIKLKNPSARLSTQLRLSEAGGRLSVAAAGTTVSIRLPGIDVDPRVRGIYGFINRLLGNPAKKKAKKLVDNFWSKKKPEVERKIKQALEEVVNKRLTKLLATKLKGFRR